MLIVPLYFKITCFCYQEKGNPEVNSVKSLPNNKQKLYTSIQTIFLHVEITHHKNYWRLHKFCLMGPIMEYNQESLHFLPIINYEKSNFAVRYFKELVKCDLQSSFRITYSGII